MEPTGETPAADIEVPSGSDPAPSRWRGRWWIPVALIALIGAVLVVLVAVGGDDGRRSLAPATTAAGATDSTTAAEPDASDVESMSSDTVVDSSSTASGTTVGASTSAPVVPPTPRPTSRPSTPPTEGPTTTWVLSSSVWATNRQSAYDITACDTVVFSSSFWDPLSLITSVAAEWSYPSESGGRITGRTVMTKEADGVWWTGTITPTGSPPAEPTPSLMTGSVHITDSTGASITLDVGPHVRITPCPAVATTTTTITATTTTTTTA